MQYKLLKNITLVTGIVFLSSSCKKDWTCECALSVNPDNPTSTISYSINNLSKSDAKTACSAFESSTDTTFYSCGLR
ncbi:MAG: hypothetical protein KJ607_01020 [Bacteroidetes bacterium]|nr:hypothetical protein [Bacteroidota bacterium]